MLIKHINYCDINCTLGIDEFLNCKYCKKNKKCATPKKFGICKEFKLVIDCRGIIADKCPFRGV